VKERPIPKRGQPLLASLRFRDFRLLWSGLLISNLGTWMQFTAMGYFVAEIARTPERAALYLGFIGAARAIPVFIFSPIAGVVADRLPRRATLFVANVVMAGAALALALLATVGHLTIAGLVMISAVNAAAQSFDSPARQSWIPFLVDRAHVGNAIGLSSVAFNAPAVIGPALAGLLIVVVGVAGSFYVNAVATLAVVAAVCFMRPSSPSDTVREPVLDSIRNGLGFIVHHPILKWIVGTFVVTALLVRPYSTLLPAFVVDTLHADARGLGFAVAAAGVGGFGGALITAYLGQRDRRGVIWLTSAAIMAVGVLVLGAAQNLWIALPILFVIGVATLAFLGSSNTLIQTLSPDDVRGRAISVYTMIALGGVQGGALVVGAVGSQIGMHWGFAAAGGIVAAMIAWIWLTKPIVRTV
jgi:MFS family permease